MDLLNIIEDGLFLLMIGCSSLEEEKILNKSQCMLEKYDSRTEKRNVSICRKGQRFS